MVVTLEDGSFRAYRKRTQITRYMWDGYRRKKEEPESAMF